MVYEKECPICGKYFTTETKIRMYCDDCIDQSDKKKKKAAKEMARSIREHRKSNLLSYKCEYCGRDHTIEARIVHKVKVCSGSRWCWDENDHYYCCVEHADQDRHDHAHCSFCGKSLKGSNYDFSMYRENNFCSYECESNYDRKIAEENGWVHKCLNCGKEFIRKGTAKYCCKDCANEGQKNANKSKPKPEPKYAGQFRCTVCGKEFSKTFRDQKKYIDESLSSTHYCSKECEETWKKECKLRHAKAVERAKKAKAEKESSKRLTQVKSPQVDELKKKLKELTADVADLERRLAELENSSTTRLVDSENCNLALCTTCKVSYKDCERMRSNFRIIPKGAHYNSRGIIVECPKYKG